MLNLRVLRTFCQLGGLLLGLLPLALSQPASDLFEKAPPQVDKALRVRVTLFYQAQVDGKFRLADTVVHEDSKDAFFVADKEQYKGFDIIKINYSDNFTKASVVTAVQKSFFMPGAGKIPVTMPMTTFWKLDQGEWWWYVDADVGGARNTPFGAMKPGEETDKSSPFYKLEHMPSAAEITSQIKINKTTVTLDCDGGSSDEIVVSNGMPGPIQLRLAADKLEGFSAKLESTDVAGKQKGRVLFTCAAGSDLGGKTASALLVLLPTNQQVPIKIVFQAAPRGAATTGK